jgi:hypothetical protein
MAVVLYGSQTGNAEEISKLLFEECKKLVKGIRLYSFEHYLKEHKQSVGETHPSARPL